MSDSGKRLIDAWTVAQAQAAGADGVPQAALVVRAAESANAGRIAEAGADLREALIHCEDMRLLFLGFQFFFRTGDHAQAEALASRRLEIAQRTGDTEHVARVCTNLGLVHLATGRLESAQLLCERALAIDEGLGNTHGVARDLGNLANVFEARRDFETAERLNHQSLAIAREIGDEAMAAGKLANLGDIAKATARPSSAGRFWREAAAAFARAGELGYARHYEGLAAAEAGSSPA